MNSNGTRAALSFDLKYMVHLNSHQIALLLSSIAFINHGKITDCNRASIAKVHELITELSKLITRKCNNQSFKFDKSPLSTIGYLTVLSC